MNTHSKQASLGITMKHINAFVLAGSIALAGFFMSQTLVKSSMSQNSIKVKGLAERTVKADTAYWTISKGLKTTDDTLSTEYLYQQYEKETQTIYNTLVEAGFKEESIEIGVTKISFEDLRDEDNNLVETKRTLRGDINIITHNVDLVKASRTKLNGLIAQGIALVNHDPEYHFTQLNDIKPDMIKLATQNAKIAAQEFANNVDATIGGIRSASQGRFSIYDVGENYTDTRKLMKNVRVVTHVDYYLED
jgi:hypothetical protein